MHTSGNNRRSEGLLGNSGIFQFLPDVVTMFDVLMFLFENYMDGGVMPGMDSDAIALELEKAGFDRQEIDCALDWLDGLIRTQTAVSEAPGQFSKSMRHYAPEECARLDVEARGFLLYLEQLGILDPVTREVVLDRVMALDVAEIGLRRLRWVVLMALYNRPDRRTALLLLQDMIMADAFDVLH